MHILIAHQCVLPVQLYGGTERVLWALGQELTRLNHKVTYLLMPESNCDFADVIFLDESNKISHLIPRDVDLVHLNFHPHDLEKIQKPLVVNIQGNPGSEFNFHPNTIFVSENHATRYGSTSFIHNGMNWDDYTQPELEKKRKYFHFLAKAAWRLKNVNGAIDVVHKAKGERLDVLGGVRFNFKMGIRLTFSRRVRFHGMVGGRQKDHLINGSKGLIFPVRWHEPFGIAITESLFYGCPVFGTPYGSLKELIHKEVGFLTSDSAEMAEAIQNVDKYSRKTCHEYAREMHNSNEMTKKYLSKYEKVICGESLNDRRPALIAEEAAFLPWT